MLAGLFFLYVGTEQALAGWVAVHAQRSSGGTSGTTWMLAPGVFWGALLAGRLAAPRFFGNWGERLHVLISLCAAACGVIVLIASESSLPVFAGVALCGIGLAPVYAHGVAGIARVFEGEAVRRARVVFAMGGLGGAALPWLVGFLSAKTGGLAAGLWTALAGVAGIACVIVLLERQLKHPR
jgi:fucose permease